MAVDPENIDSNLSGTRVFAVFYWEMERVL
jgi:hypothetical protein